MSPSSGVLPAKCPPEIHGKVVMKDEIVAYADALLEPAGAGAGQ